VLNSNDDWSEYRNSYRFDLPHIPATRTRISPHRSAQAHAERQDVLRPGVTFFKTERKSAATACSSTTSWLCGQCSPQLRGRHSLVLPGYGGTPGDPLSDSLAAARARRALWTTNLRRQSSTWVSVGCDFPGERLSSAEGGLELERHSCASTRTLPLELRSGAARHRRLRFDELATRDRSIRSTGRASRTSASAYLQDKYEGAGCR